MKISKINPYKSDSSKTKAFFDIVSEDGITIRGLTLVEGSNGLFVNFLSEKGKDGKYYDKIQMSKEMKDELTELAVQECHKA